MNGRLELFRYAVLRTPSPEEAKDGRKTEIVIPPTEFALYPNEEAVRFAAIRAIPTELLETTDTSRFEVAVASF